MKSRKIISLLSAAAMSASVFSGLALTVHAAEPVWSYDGSDISIWPVESNGEPKAGAPLTEIITDDLGEYVRLSARGSSSYTATVELPEAAKLMDNYVIEYDVMIHQSNGMQRLERYSQVAFISSDPTPAYDTRDFVAYREAYNDEYGSGANTATDISGVASYTTGVASSVSSIYGMASAQINATNDTPLALSDDTSGILSDKWYRVQTAVSGTTATVNVIDTNGAVITNGQYTNSASQLESLYVNVARGDNGVTGPGVVCLDNIRIYEGTAEALTSDGLRDENTGSGGNEDPDTSASAPSITLPEGAVQSLSQNFNSYDAETLISIPQSTTAPAPYEGIDGISVSVGARSNGTDTTSYAAINEVAVGDMALNLTSGRFSNGSKGPIMSLNDNLALESADSPTSVMAFAVKLSSTGTVPGKLYLLDNSTNLDDNGVARDRLAVLSTEEDVSGYTNGETPIGIHVDAEEWYSVVVTVNPNADAAVTENKIPSTYRVFVFDSEGNNLSGSQRIASVSAETVNRGDTATSVNNLPVLASAQDSASIGSGNAQIALIDNLLTYTTTSTEFDQNGVLPVLGEPAEPEAPAAVGVTMTVNEDDQTVSLTATTAGSAILVQASYNTAKVLSDINVVPVSITTEGIALSASGEGAQLNAFTRGDKFMVFDSLADLTPLFDAHTVVNGAEPVEPETYGITVTTPVNGTVTTDPSGSAEAGDTVTITASPAEGYEVDTITVTAADQSTVTVTDNEFTMPAQAVTVTVTFKEASTQPDDPDNEYAAALVHTGYITSGTSMGTAGVSVDTADGNELFNSWGGGSSGALYGQTAYAQFEFDDSAPTNNIASIDFTFTVTGASDDTQTRSINVYLMPADFPSLENATIESANLGSLLGSVSGSTSETKEFTFKITDPTVISDIMENKDQVIIGVSDRNKGGTLSGLNSQTPPTLTIVQGEQVTLTTKVDGTATAGVTVAIDGVNYVSNENGVISLYLPVGTHTYAVEGGTYEAISATNFNVAADTGYTADINLTVSTVVAVPDRALPTGVTQLHEVASTTAQGNSTVLLPTAAREGIGLPETLTADYTFTIDYDIYIPVNASISLGAQNADRLGTMFNFTADSEGKLTVTATESGSSTKTVSDALSAGKWYNVKVVHTTTTANDGNFTTGPMTITISDVDIETGTVGSAVATLSDIAARNNVNGDEARAYNSLNFSSVTGNVMLNNIYVYTADTATD